MKFHFSGICGAGMGNVALLLKAAGHEVKGSDANTYPPMSVQLEDAGIEIMEGYGASRIEEGFSPDVQVISNVLSRNHEEVLHGQALGLEQLSFPQILERYLLPSRVPFVVAGTHGKTTTSTLLAQLLEGEGAGYFVGGAFKNGASGVRLGKEGAPFVLEGDEYDTAFFDKHSKFLHYAPKVLLLTHLEWDHVDIFPEFEDMLAEFRSLIRLLPQGGCLVYCGDHQELVDLSAGFSGQCLSYGVGEGCDFRILNAVRAEGITKLKILGPEGEFELETPMVGEIYHLNALGAYLAARWGQGVEHEVLNEVLKGLEGAKRRCELIEHPSGTVISDFAHHPTAVAETIRICRESYPNHGLVAVFDPRNATSRRRVFEERLSSSLGMADRVILAPVHRDDRLSEEEKMDGERMQELVGVKCRYHHQPEAFVEDVISEIQEKNVVLIMSCGACHGLFDRL